MDILIHFITKYIQLSSDDIEFLSKNIQIAKYEKGDTIHCIGDVFQNIMLIQYGMVRSYIIKENGKDFTWHFHFSNEEYSNLKNIFVVDYVSFTHKEPSKLYFEALSACEMLVIKYDILEMLYKTDVKWQYLGRKIAEEAYAITQDRTFSLLSLSAHERLIQLCQEYPDIFNKVPHYYIASFLGIAPQHLSRLRQSLTKVNEKTF